MGDARVLVSGAGAAAAGRRLGGCRGQSDRAQCLGDLVQRRDRPWGRGQGLAHGLEVDRRRAAAAADHAGTGIAGKSGVGGHDLRRAAIVDMAVAILRNAAIALGDDDVVGCRRLADPDVIDEGLEILTQQQRTNTGPLDILGVDAEGTLVVIELKNEAGEGHIDQGLRYYDWCRQNLPWIAEAYGKAKINIKSVPRLFLIAPAYTETVRQIAKYVAVGVDLRLFEYHAVENDKGERGVICNEIDLDRHLSLLELCQYPIN